MCIILGHIHSVKSTRIFVLPNQSKTRQLTFYKNSVSTPDENLMILPVPNIETIVLEKVKYKALFDDLHSSVTYDAVSRVPYETASFTRSLSAAATLQVIEHGSYLVSIAPTLADLSRLDTRIFDVPTDLDAFFRKHYSSEFGYLCCVLKEGSKTYEPLAYSHRLHSNGRLFVPTLHFHNHYGRVDTDHADWDHLIYSAETLQEANYKYRSNPTNAVKWKKLPADFCLSPSSPIRCAELTGHHANRDLSFVIA